MTNRWLTRIIGGIAALSLSAALVLTIADLENLEREAGCGSCRGLPSQLQLSFGPSLLYDCEWRLWLLPWLLPFGHTVLRAERSS